MGNRYPPREQAVGREGHEISHFPWTGLGECFLPTLFDVSNPSTAETELAKNANKPSSTASICLAAASSGLERIVPGSWKRSRVANQ